MNNYPVNTNPTAASDYFMEVYRVPGSSAWRLQLVPWVVFTNSLPAGPVGISGTNGTNGTNGATGPAGSVTNSTSINTVTVNATNLNVSVINGSPTDENYAPFLTSENPTVNVCSDQPTGSWGGVAVLTNGLATVYSVNASSNNLTMLTVTSSTGAVYAVSMTNIMEGTSFQIASAGGSNANKTAVGYLIFKTIPAIGAPCP